MCLLTYVSICLFYLLPASQWTISPFMASNMHVSLWRPLLWAMCPASFIYSSSSPFPVAPTLFKDHAGHWGYHGEQEDKNCVFHGAYNPVGETIVR